MTEFGICEIEGVRDTTTRVFAAFLDVTDGRRINPVGVLTVDDRRGTVELVAVDEAYQRQGLATRLLAFARETTGLDLTRDEGTRSPAGEAWAAANGIEPDGRSATMSEREAQACAARVKLGIYDVLLGKLVAASA